MSWENFTTFKSAGDIVSVGDIVDLHKAIDERIKLVFDAGSGVLQPFPAMVTKRLGATLKNSPASDFPPGELMHNVIISLSSRFARRTDDGDFGQFAGGTGADNNVVRLAGLALGYSSAAIDEIFLRNVSPGAFGTRTRDIHYYNICRKAVQLLGYPMPHRAQVSHPGRTTNKVWDDPDLYKQLSEAALEDDWADAKSAFLPIAWNDSAFGTAPIASLVAQRFYNSGEDVCAYRIRSQRWLAGLTLSPEWAALKYQLFCQVFLTHDGTESNTAKLVAGLGGNEENIDISTPSEVTLIPLTGVDSETVSSDVGLSFRAAEDSDILDEVPRPQTTTGGCDGGVAFTDDRINIPGVGLTFGPFASVEFEYGDDSP